MVTSSRRRRTALLAVCCDAGSGRARLGRRFGHGHEGSYLVDDDFADALIEFPPGCRIMIVTPSPATHSTRTTRPSMYATEGV